MQIFKRCVRYRVVGLAVSVGAATVLSGCSAGTVVQTAVKVGQLMRESQAGRNASATVDESYTQSLTPTQAGAGLMVCEPSVAPGTSSELTAFGAGCARWLQLHAAGHGELGQTPLWGQAVDAQETLKRKDLRLTSADAAPYANLLGVTHLAVGSIKGNGAHVSISYQLYEMRPQQKAIGKPIVISGSQAQIIAALPQTARTLATRLGVKTPRVPSLQLAPAEMAFLGQVPWKARQAVKPEIANRLAGLAPREPLAGILFFRSGAPLRDEKQCQAVIDQLMKKSSGNTLVTADVAQFFTDKFKPYEKGLATSRKRFPNNYLLANSDLYWQWHLEEWDDAKAAAEAGVRAAPRNPLAWERLETYLSEHASDIRQGKFYSDMTWQEKQAVSQLYPQALAAALRVTQLSPNDSMAWQNVAVDATFDGYDALADKALWKAIELDKTNSEAYYWGLQMYQPKWGGDSQKLLQVARLAVQNADPNNFPAKGLVDSIHHGGLKAQKEELLTAAVKRSPKNALLNYELGAVFHYDKRSYRKAEQYYQVALTSDPKLARAVSSLADLTFFVKNQPKEAERLYIRAVILDPQNGHLRANLARCLANTDQRTAAIKEAKQALKTGADRSHPVFSQLGL